MADTCRAMWWAKYPLLKKWPSTRAVWDGRPHSYSICMCSLMQLVCLGILSIHSTIISVQFTLNMNATPRKPGMPMWGLSVDQCWVVSPSRNDPPVFFLKRSWLWIDVSACVLSLSQWFGSFTDDPAGSHASRPVWVSNGLEKMRIPKTTLRTRSWRRITQPSRNRKNPAAGRLALRLILLCPVGLPLSGSLLFWGEWHWSESCELHVAWACRRPSTYGTSIIKCHSCRRAFFS